MIAIARPAAPALLLTRGAAATAELCEVYSSGARVFAFELHDLLHQQIAVSARPELLPRLQMLEARLRARQEATAEYAGMNRAYLKRVGSDHPGV
jgi:hypothetical protein